MTMNNERSKETAKPSRDTTSLPGVTGMHPVSIADADETHERIATPAEFSSSQSKDAWKCTVQKFKEHASNAFFLGGTRSEQPDQVDQVGKHFRKVALIGLAMYVAILGITVYLTPEESFHKPRGVEKNIHLLTFLLLFVTNGSRLVPLALRTSGGTFYDSGVLFSLLVVQGIAMFSNLSLALLPTPKLHDPIAGMDVTMLRWVEWYVSFCRIRFGCESPYSIRKCESTCAESFY